MLRRLFLWIPLALLFCGPAAVAATPMTVLDQSFTGTITVALNMDPFIHVGDPFSGRVVVLSDPSYPGNFLTEVSIKPLDQFKLQLGGAFLLNFQSLGAVNLAAPEVQNLGFIGPFFAPATAFDFTIAGFNVIGQRYLPDLINKEPAALAGSITTVTTEVFPVPEPGTFGTLLAGMSILGFVIYRRGEREILARKGR